MITLTVRGPAQRRVTIQETATDRYRNRTNRIETVEIEIHREWHKPHPNLDAFADRHPQSIASSLADDLGDYHLGEPQEWAAEMTATSESMLQSARSAAWEWDSGTSTLDVLIKWDEYDLFPELPIRAAIDRLGHLLQTNEGRRIDRGNPSGEPRP